MQHELLSVYASPLPFGNRRERVFAVHGQTLEEIVTLASPRMVGVDKIVLINDEVIPPRHWKKIRPKKNAIVNINIVPQGGGGKKNPLTTILSIAVMVAAPYAGAALGGSLGITSTIGLKVLTAGIGIVGNMLVSALAPPPKPSKSASAGDDPAENPTQFIEGSTNAINPFGVIPICLGKNRMIPPQAARPYTEVAGDQQFVRQLFLWGYGNYLLIRDIKIGETAIGDFVGVQANHRLVGDLNSGTALYTSDVFQDDYNILLTFASGYALRTTQMDVDEASVDITFAQGLTRFNEEGKRAPTTVELELQFAVAGSGVWSASGVTFTAYSGNAFGTPDVPINSGIPVEIGGVFYYRGTRTDIIALNPISGEITAIRGTGNGFTIAEQVPAGLIRLASYTAVTSRPFNSVTTTTSIEDFSDDRDPATFGTSLQDSSSFVPSYVGTTVTISSGALRFNALTITGAQTEALRRSVNIIFPARGQYDIRVRRLTADAVEQNTLDKAYLSAIRSITHQQPVLAAGLNGSAIRIQGTDQLNGSISQLNAEVSSVILDYNADIDAWQLGETSNPASIYRYVLQSPANAKAIPDERIDLEALEAWHVYCTERGYTYNRVIDYETSVDAVLRDVAAAGRATPDRIDGLYTVIVDGPKPDIIQMVTPRNSWDYKGSIVYPDLPHAFRVEFRNADAGYNQDERIVYADGYTAATATKFERLDFQSCTNSDLAYKHGRMYLATAKLRPEIHSFSMEVDNLVFTRGDRIQFSSDVIFVGVGDGRITSITYDDPNTPTVMTGFVIDDVVTIPNTADFNARIRKKDGRYIFQKLVTNIGVETSTFVFVTPVDIDDAAEIGDLVQFAEVGKELDLVVTRIEPRADLTARITALDYAPAIFTAEVGTIPPFTSDITAPIEFRPLLAPLLAGPIQSDESVMTRNSDGTFTNRMVITLQNRNGGNVVPIVRIRQSGTTAFTSANLLQSTPELVVVTGLDDGNNYDVHIRYQSVGGLSISPPLQLNSTRFIGAGTNPANVSNFLITVTGETAQLKWDANPDIDISHYVIKYSRAYTGVTWATAQVLESNIRETRITIPFQGGTYLIKAVDILGYESVTATAIITFNPGQVRNVIETLTESPTFPGTKDNCEESGGALQLLDTSAVGYYYFDNGVDLTAIYSSFVSATVIARGENLLRIRSLASIRSALSIRGMGLKIRSLANIRSAASIRGIDFSDWAVTLQYRVTNDDPTGSPVWSAWLPLSAGTLEFWGIEFRLKLESFDSGVTPYVTTLEVLIDMPDRVERGEDLNVTALSGVTVTYNPAFKNNPAVAVTIQNGATDDRIEYISKDSSGFVLKVYNATSAAYVARVIDYIASGYGRVQ